MNGTFLGKCGISARVLADSITFHGDRLITLEITYPRIILAEYNTHRMLSRNSSSSRAIPFTKMVDNCTGRPVRFGGNIAGMQDNGEHDALVAGRTIETSMGIGCPALEPEDAWEAAKQDAIFWATAFHNAGYHKQIVNRLTEPFQMMKTVTSGTEWLNYFWLRDHDAADPSIAELARVMRLAIENSTPDDLGEGEYHLPYINVQRHGGDGGQIFFLNEDDTKWENLLTLEQAITVSIARCAAVSFRNIDYGVDVSRNVYDRLVGDGRKHASALEHVATPMKMSTWDIDQECGINDTTMPSTWERGISHTDRDGNLWSGNFRGFIQYRKLVDGENYTGE